MKKKLLFTVCNCALLLFAVNISQAQVKGDPKPRAAAPRVQVIDKSPSRLSPELKNLYEATTPSARRSAVKPLPVKDGLSKYIQIKGDRVVVDITVKGDYAAARAELDKAGFKRTAAFGRIISGTIPIKGLPLLESVNEVKFVRPALKPMHQGKPLNPDAISGDRRDERKGKIVPVISQGDTAQRSYLARQSYGRKKLVINGSGVKVGILSDSYNNLGTAATGVAGGELPGQANPLNYKKPVQVLMDLDSNGTDEGRAMAEIVHDVAPGAEIAFHTGFGGQAVMAQGIMDLAKNGCQVITDDLLYYAEPFFQDGIIAQAAEKVKRNGVTYLSSAGNNSVRSYESNYRSSNVAPFGIEYGTAHNFSAPGDEPRYLQPVFVPKNGYFVTSLQWDQPFFSAGGKGAESDFDIYLLNQNLEVVAGSIANNIENGDPVEVFGFENDSTNTDFYLLILKFAGPDPSFLKYVSYGSFAFYLTNPAIPGILTPSLTGHAKAEGVIATGAAFFANTPAYGVDTPRVEGFSAVGGVPHFFDLEGNRIPTIVRKKPDIVAPDGGNTSFFAPFPDPDTDLDTDTLPNFYGTSAAAPHAAGTVALMIDAQKLNTITPAQIKGVLADNTVDMDDVWTDGFDKGFDFNTGAGLIKADAAVNVVRFPNLYVKSLDLISLCSDNPAATRNWKITNPNPFEVKAFYFVAGFSENGSVIVPPGGTTFVTQTARYQNWPAPNVVILNWDDNFGFPHFDIARSTRAVCGQMATQNSADETLEGSALAETLEKMNTAEVYPNPSSTFFRLYLSIADPKKIDIELYAIDGKRLYRKVAQSNGIFDIDASGFKPGIYILKVRQGDFNKTIKLIKK